MIVVEDKLKEIFERLPAMKYEVGGAHSFIPVFGYGSQIELNKFLKSQESEQTHPYPLIWLLYPYKELHKKKKVELDDLVLILATNTNSQMLNKERIDTNFKKVLIPLFDNIQKAFKLAVNVNLLQEVEVVKFPNYSGDDDKESSSFTTDLWDAMKTIWQISINTACLRA